MEPNNNLYSNDYGGYGYAAPEITLSQYVVRTFTWMFIGLLVTFGIAYGGYATGMILYVFTVPYLPIPVHYRSASPRWPNGRHI